MILARFHVLYSIVFFSITQMSTIIAGVTFAFFGYCVGNAVKRYQLAKQQYAALEEAMRKHDQTMSMDYLQWLQK